MELYPAERIEAPHCSTNDLAWRYVQTGTRNEIDRLLHSPSLEQKVLSLLPTENISESYNLDALTRFFRGDLSPDRRIALSQIVDQYMETVLGGISISRCDLHRIDLSFLKTEQGARLITYEFMPTWEATGTTPGGLSEAEILIEPGSPESKMLHAHPGWRIVTSLEKGGKLALPDGTVPLEQGAVVFMPKLTKHSFQDGRYFAIHGNEPGFDNEEAIHWLNELPQA